MVFLFIINKNSIDKGITLCPYLKKKDKDKE
jgi:hypothetical protein